MKLGVIFKLTSDTFVLWIGFLACSVAWIRDDGSIPGIPARVDPVLSYVLSLKLL